MYKMHGSNMSAHVSVIRLGVMFLSIYEVYMAFSEYVGKITSQIRHIKLTDQG